MNNVQTMQNRIINDSVVFYKEGKPFSGDVEQSYSRYNFMHDTNLPAERTLKRLKRLESIDSVFYQISLLKSMFPPLTRGLCDYADLATLLNDINGILLLISLRERVDLLTADRLLYNRYSNHAYLTRYAPDLDSLVDYTPLDWKTNACESESGARYLLLIAQCCICGN